jgi:hypothetical protein
VPFSPSEQRKAVRLRTAVEPSERLDATALSRDLDRPALRVSTAPNTTPAKLAMSARRTTPMRTAVARRSPQDEWPAATMANYLVRELRCCEAHATRVCRAHALAHALARV